MLRCEPCQVRKEAAVSILGVCCGEACSSAWFSYALYLYVLVMYIYIPAYTLYVYIPICSIMLKSRKKVDAFFRD